MNTTSLHVDNTSGNHPQTVLIPLVQCGNPMGIPPYVLHRICEKMAIPLYYYAHKSYITLENSHLVEAALINLQQGRTLSEIHAPMALSSVPLHRVEDAIPPVYSSTTGAYSVGHVKGAQWLQSNGRVYHTPEQIMPKPKRPNASGLPVTGGGVEAMLPKALRRLAPSLERLFHHPIQ
jgi:hypothetical protein